LGSFDESVIFQHWTTDKIKYSGLRIESKGIIYGVLIPTENQLPCIIDAIKPLFGITKRGMHQLQIGSRRYIIHYIPVGPDRTVVWETPVSALDSKHPLRRDPDFRQKLQSLIAFCDILGLSQTGEYSFWIRPNSGVVGSYVPINVNHKIPSLMKAEIYDYSILTKVLIDRWIGEDLPIADIVKSMVNFNQGAGPSDARDLVTVSTILRDQISAVIRHFDPNYIWYTNFIMDRLTRYLLF
jgi:hypothetical protein